MEVSEEVADMFKEFDRKEMCIRDSRKPARIAANVSPIASLKNQGETINYRSHKRHRITPAYLAKISFFRNRKKSVLDVYKRQTMGSGRKTGKGRFPIRTDCALLLILRWRNAPLIWTNFSI